MQVATLVTPDGAYGGPIRVALNQLEELQRRGHTVELVAGTSGFDEVPTQMQGVPVSLFPVRRVIPRSGFAGLTSPGLLAHVKRSLNSVDVAHVHMARDLVTLPAAAVIARSEVPLFVQPHGMIDESGNPLAKVLDLVATRRVLHGSERVLSLTPEETQSLRAVAGHDLPITTIANGVEIPADRAAPTAGGLEFLFLARLHPRKRAPMFVRAASRLLSEGLDADFVLVGPDEGDGAEVRELIAASAESSRIRWEGSLPPDATLGRMSTASVYVLPSVGEVLSMSILEAMSLGLPVVITDSNGLAPAVAAAEAGLVIDPTEDALVEALLRIATDEPLRLRLGANAAQLVESDYSIKAVGLQLESLYRSHRTREPSDSEQP
ncbi:glycosyltransferase [Herbiconiux sp. P18]|uniref:glycosyltransferase n=1 Tax=Herbiconiux liangxiaofengii TaxID=3342795 RepID=UPI0035BB33AB